jgi:hypothetical protein
LAAAVGAASMIQPELLPGAVAIVGKMASDSAKNTVIKIATDEGKKVGAAIGQDIKDDAAKQKAAKAGQEAPDGTSGKTPAPEARSDSKAFPVDASKDAPKGAQVSNDLTNSHESIEKSAQESVVKPGNSADAPLTETPKPIESEPSAAEKPSSTPVAVVAAATSIRKTTTTTNTSSQEPVAASEKALATITQESLDQLHRSIFTAHSSGTALTAHRD